VTQATNLRKTGISAVGVVPWGTHFCHFYQTKQDLLDILVPCFIAGLKNGEFCVWIVFDPLDEARARKELIRAFPKAAQHLSKGDIQIIPHSAFYLKDGILDLRKTIEAIKGKLAQALAQGYAGMRVNGNEAWLTEEDWKNFWRYERYLNDLIANQKMIVLCTYPLAIAKAGELFDVAATHQFAIARRRGKWEVLETPALNQTKEELHDLSRRLEQRVAERTAELATANQKLTREIAKRGKTTEQLRMLTEKLRALSASAQSAREEEGTRIAREIHDELGSALTTLKWDTEGLLELASREGSYPASRKVIKKLEAMKSLTDSTIRTVQRIASEIRPSILDDFGLIAAIESQAQQFQSRTGITSSFESTLNAVNLNPDQSNAVFRIFQEALTNILRHANATRVNITAEAQAGHFVLIVRDNGKGITDEAKSRPLSLGLLGMEERARFIAGKLTITGATGKGTTVTLRVPISSPPQADTDR
jgi:signal transduction histidine kinase